MNEEKTQAQDELPTVGQILKKHREQANVSIDSIATPLKLSHLQVQQLENDDFELLGPITFVKGYIKNYCRELKVDATPILNMMPAPPELAKPTNMQSFSRRTEKEANDNRLMLFSYLILAVVLGSSALWFWQNSTPIEEQTNNLNVENSKLRERQIMQPPIIKSEEVISDNETLQESPSSPLKNETTKPKIEIPKKTQMVTNATETVAAKNNNLNSNSTIVMNFNDESWVEIHDGGGERIAFGVKKAGYEMIVTGKPPFSVVLGKHNEVSVSLNGEPVDISGFPKNRLAKFKLPLAE